MSNPMNHKESQETLGASTDSIVVDITDKTVNELKKEELKDGISKDVEKTKEKKVLSEDDEKYVSFEITGGKLYAIVFALCIICLLASLDMTIVATALPTIAKEFEDIGGYTWVITSYMLSSTAFQPMYGKFADIFGRRAMMIFALAVFIISSIFCGMSGNMDTLIVFRGIQGIGGGGLMSLCMIIIADVIPIRKRGQYMGIIGAVASFSTVVGPLVGGLFTDHISWRWAFYINVPLAIISFIIILLYVKIPTPADNLKQKLLRIDYSGTVILILGVVSLLLALEWGGVDYAWSSWQIILLFCLFAFFFVIFVIVELKLAREPIIPPEIFKVRNINCMIVACTLIGFAFMGSCTFIPLYFQMVRGMKATTSGLMMIPMSIIVTILNIGSGAYIGKYGHVNILFIIGFILSAASGYVYSLFDLDTSTFVIILIVSFGALGTGLTRQNMILVAQDSAPKAILASTTAVVSFFQIIGGIIGIAIFNTILNNRVPKRLHELDPKIDRDSVDMKLINTYGRNGLRAYNDGLRTNFLIIIPCSLLALVAVLCTKNVRLNKKPQESNEKDTSSDTIKPEKNDVDDNNTVANGSTVVDVGIQSIESTTTTMIVSLLVLIIGIALTMAFPQLKNSIQESFSSLITTTTTTTTKTATKIPVKPANSENLSKAATAQEGAEFHPKFIITSNNSGETNYEFKCTFEDNETTRELVKRFPLKMTMVDLNGTEKYHTLSEPLPVRIQPVDKVRYGDILLFQSRYLAVFYDTFDPVKQYSIIGKIDNPEKLREAVGTGSITASFVPTKTESNKKKMN
ncbi:hypothetical protein PIROE2DRAFT_68647 [Piromyces sp. E2]|nr:hypothetical protein PIROE2DRAFT_68647 [Piromyces sp. E2]|eukprot:OUM68842.1 hypothetical protein PIROE2DRAFT_68647 [Piromyces sp. E2]